MREQSPLHFPSAIELSSVSEVSFISIQSSSFIYFDVIKFGILEDQVLRKIVKLREIYSRGSSAKWLVIQESMPQSSTLPKVNGNYKFIGWVGNGPRGWIKSSCWWINVIESLIGIFGSPSTAINKQLAVRGGLGYPVKGELFIYH